MLSKKGFIIGAVVIVAVVAGWLAFRWVAKSDMAVKRLTKELQAVVERGSGGLYTLEIGSVKVVPEQLQIHLYEIKLIPNNELYEKQMEEGIATPDLVSLEVDKLTINNITPANFIANKSIVLQSIELHKAMVEVKHHDKPKKNTPTDSTKFQPENLYARLKNDISKISVDTIVFSTMDLRYINRKKKGDTTYLKDLSIFAENFLLDETSYEDSSRFLFTKKLVVQSLKFESPLKNQQYNLQFDTLRMVISGSTHTTVKNFKLRPLYSEKEYSSRVTTQLERFNVQVPSLQLVNFQYNELLENGLIVADSLQIKNAHLGIYKDRSKLFDGKTRLGKYPHQLLQHSGLPINVKVCTLQNTDIVYREKSDKTEQTGEVKFMNTQAVIAPIFSGENGNTVPVQIYANSYFMGSSPLKASFTLYPASKDGDFKVTGDFGRLDLKDLNKATIHLGEVRIDTGVVEELSFNITANDYFSTTRLHFRYSGLKASLLKQEEGAAYKKKGFLSFMANTFVLKSDNHKRAQNVVVRYQRDTDKSMFNLIWKGVFSGMKELSGTGGLGKDKDRVKILSKN